MDRFAPRGLPDGFGGAGVEPLPHPGDGEERRGTDLLDGFGEALDVGLVVDHVAGHRRGEHGDDLLGDVGEGQVGDDPVGRAHRDQVDEGGGHVAEGPVRQHDRFGHPGGARGVEQGRPVLGAEGVHPGLEGGIGNRAAAGDELVPGHHAVGCHRAVVHHHDPAQVGHLGALGEDAVQPLPVLHQDHRGLGVVDDVCRLLGGVGRVDPRRHPSDRHGGDVEDGPLGLVGPEDAHHLPGFHAEGEQALGRGAHPGHVLGPGGGGPALPVMDGVGHGRAPLGTGPQGPADDALEPHGGLPLVDGRVSAGYASAGRSTGGTGRVVGDELPAESA